MTERTARPPVRPRSGRRPLPPLIFLLVLAVAAGAVWWTVIRQDNAKRAEAAAACEEAEAAPPSLDPATVSVRVLNATDTGGLAQQVADDLSGRGFTVSEIANDSSDRQVEGVGEVRYGARGEDPARFLAVFMPGAGTYRDTRADAVVDLVIGPEFVWPESLATPEAVTAALEAVPEPDPNC
ncbi:LytR C-terminal domain-containing protein [Blastococcus xanthinilyticus]|uniref:LytR cell envelope-related transcriptional attenuator n=1 Tax=Blastococcus xanthinilyticus TaxID=1564164 RepID=A0A5S5D3W8_9ACTN|nr:LytR C-terminal domain-containing protein [Blastococcus xanthinilyticus]TYP90651.1 LytR cell envelope-related transcriptional attenuator [Blastococcus xanthinilyticus]